MAWSAPAPTCAPWCSAAGSSCRASGSRAARRSRGRHGRALHRRDRRLIRPSRATLATAVGSASPPFRDGMRNLWAGCWAAAHAGGYHLADGRRALRVPAQARTGHPGAFRAQAQPDWTRRPLRGPRAPRPPAALGPATGTRRRAGLLGDPERDTARTPTHNRKAVHVEDHPFEYIDFAGTIPQGNYGAGEISVLGQRHLQRREVGAVKGDRHLPRSSG